MRKSRILVRAVSAILAVVCCLIGTAPIVALGALVPGDIVVVDNEAVGGPAIIRVDPVTGLHSLISQGGGFIQPAALAIDANGDILVADAAFGGPGIIFRVNPNTGAQTIISSGGGLFTPIGITIDATGDLLVADPQAFGGAAGIIRIDPVTGAQSSLTSGGSLLAPRRIAIDAAGDLLVTDSAAFGGQGGIIRVNPVTGAQTTVSSGGGFQDPIGIVIDALGTLFVADSNGFGPATGNPPGAVLGVDPLTGAQSSVSSLGIFIDPVAVAIDATGDLLVLDTGSGGGTGFIVRIDLGIADDGLGTNQTVISSGGLFFNPSDIAIVPVPEPGTLALLALGGGLMFTHRRQRSR